MSFSEYTVDELEFPDYVSREHEDMRSLAGKTISHTGWIDGWPFLFFTDGTNVHFSGYEAVGVIVDGIH